MRLLIHDTLVTAPFVVGLAEAWVVPAEGIEAEARPDVPAAAVGAEDAALLPATEAAALGGSHRILPDAAIVAGAIGAVALRTPVRPDEVPAGPVRLLAVSGTSEVLARATLRPFYGIEPTGWPRRDDDPAAPQAQATIVDGAEALRPIEGGFAEDLCRAWLILSGTPAVSHLLVAPAAADRAALAPLLATLAALREAAHERRREWRPALAAREGIPPDRLYALLAEQRLALTTEDRRALRLLLERGGRGVLDAAGAEPRFLEDGWEAPGSGGP